MAEAICHQLETFDFYYGQSAAGVLWVELRGLLAADVEAPEPAPEPEDADTDEPPVDEQEPTEAPEPCPDSLNDEDRRDWQEYNAVRDPEDQIPEGEWIEYRIAMADAVIDNR